MGWLTYPWIRYIDSHMAGVEGLLSIAKPAAKLADPEVAASDQTIGQHDVKIIGVHASEMGDQYNLAQAGL